MFFKTLEEKNVPPAAELMENTELILSQNEFHFKESNQCNDKKEQILKFFCKLLTLDLVKRLKA